MVDVELVQHELEPRHKLASEFGGRNDLSAKLRRDLLDRGGKLAEHSVAR